MKSENIGAGISAVEILNVSPHGFWLLTGGREYFWAWTIFHGFARRHSSNYSTLNSTMVTICIGRSSTWTWTWNGSRIRKNFPSWPRQEFDDLPVWVDSDEMRGIVRGYV